MRSGTSDSPSFNLALLIKIYVTNPLREINWRHPHPPIIYLLLSLMRRYCRWYFWSPCKAGVGFLNNPQLHGLIRLTTTVSELIGWRFIFGVRMKSAASAPGPARWGLQPLLFGHARWLKTTCSDPSQWTDLEVGVWPAPDIGLNQHS